MDYGIIVDSCCDMTPQLMRRLDITSVPLIMRLGEKEFVDDDSLDLNGFMAEMKACTERVGSASPAPYFYQQTMENERQSFVVTLSSKLSGSYANAIIAKTSVEEGGKAETYVFDSKSASAGEVLVAVKIREMINKGADRATIIKNIESFIDNMKTYFVLENYDNLMKNGRLNKITGKIINVMNIKLVMGSDGNGNIALYDKSRGIKHVLEKLIHLIESSGKKTEGECLVISHCNNQNLASRLSQMIQEKFRFGEILVVPTGGLSSLYCDDNGIVIAF